jgi:thiamine biosynthesis lipoprotein ApbE
MLYTNSQFLLGTHIDITIASSDQRTPEKIAILFDYFRAFEAEFSRFLPDSSLSQLNQKKTLEVSSRFIDLVQLSL